MLGLKVELGWWWLLTVLILGLLAACEPGGPKPEQAPRAISGVLAQPGDSSVTLTWAGIAAGHYNLYWATSPGVTPQNGTAIKRAQSPYHHTGLNNGTTYYYILTALNTGGEGSPSQEISATPQSLSVSPQALRVTGNKTATLDWQPVAGVIGYHIYSATASGVSPENYTTWVGGTMFSSETPSLQVADLQYGIRYYFVVTGVTPAGETQLSNEVFLLPRMLVAVAVGQGYSCAIEGEGALWCWGLNHYGQLGNGTTDNKLTPTQVGTAVDWQKVATGGTHLCGIKGQGELWCWGHNYYGQLGDSTTGNKLVPTQVGGVSGGWQEFALGQFHSCGIKKDGSLWCWGNNTYGQLGLGALGVGHQNTPTQVGSDENWDKLVAGESHTCALKKTGAIWCWGLNSSSQLGDETQENKNVPVRVGVEEDWRAIAASNNRTCALKNSDSLWCWGYNIDQFNNLSNKNSPVQVGAEVDWRVFVSNLFNICLLKKAGALWCSAWDISQTVHAGISAIDWRSLAASPSHSCGLKEDESLWCWGENEFGQLGNGVIGKQPLPINLDQSLPAWLEQSLLVWVNQSLFKQ